MGLGWASSPEEKSNYVGVLGVRVELSHILGPRWWEGEVEGSQAGLGARGRKVKAESWNKERKGEEPDGGSPSLRSAACFVTRCGVSQ